MGALTLAEFRTELIFDLENREDLLLAENQTRLNRWINFAYLYVSQPAIHMHWELEATDTIALVADTLEYSIATAPEWNAIDKVHYAESATPTPATRRQKVDPVGYQRFISQQHTSSPGGPKLYAIRNNKIHVTPVPDSTVAGNSLVLEGWKKPVVLSADSDVTVIPGEWDDIILLGAKYLAATRLGMLVESEQAKQEFGILINEISDRRDFGIANETGFMPDLEGDD